MLRSLFTSENVARFEDGLLNEIHRPEPTTQSLEMPNIRATLNSTNWSFLQLLAGVDLAEQD